MISIQSWKVVNTVLLYTLSDSAAFHYFILQVGQQVADYFLQW